MVLSQGTVMKYLSPSIYCSNIIARVKDFNMHVKHQGQGHKLSVEVSLI
jgi:hypothetical protein